MAQDTTQKVPVVLAALDASGAAVDLTVFPTALTGVTYTSDNADATLTPSGNDVTVSVTTPATVNLTVKATNVAGTEVTATVAVVFDVAVPLVATVTLTPGAPTAK